MRSVTGSGSCVVGCLPDKDSRADLGPGSRHRWARPGAAPVDVVGLARRVRSGVWRGGHAGQPPRRTRTRLDSRGRRAEAHRRGRGRTAGRARRRPGPGRPAPATAPRSTIDSRIAAPDRSPAARADRAGASSPCDRASARRPRGPDRSHRHRDGDGRGRDRGWSTGACAEPPRPRRTRWRRGAEAGPAGGSPGPDAAIVGPTAATAMGRPSRGRPTPHGCAGARTAAPGAGPAGTGPAGAAVPARTTRSTRRAGQTALRGIRRRSGRSSPSAGSSARPASRRASPGRPSAAARLGRDDQRDDVVVAACEVRRRQPRRPRSGRRSASGPRRGRGTPRRRARRPGERLELGPGQAEEPSRRWRRARRRSDGR